MVGAPQSTHYSGAARSAVLDAVRLVKLKLAARWLSSRGVDKQYRELSEGRAHAGQLSTLGLLWFIAHYRRGLPPRLDIPGLDGLGSQNERISVRLLCPAATLAFAPGARGVT